MQDRPSPGRAADGGAPGGAAGGRRKLRPAHVVVYLLFLWLLVELGSAAALWALARKGTTYAPRVAPGLLRKHVEGVRAHLASAGTYIVVDPELGWTLGPSRRRRGYRTNAQAVRADREYAPAPPPGVLRIAAFGDSFTHASDVANPNAWSRRLEELAPRVEVLNYGVPGYGPDQALLRWRRDGRTLRPHVVLIGFMSDNVHRVVNTFRPFFFANSGMAVAKPRFRLRGDRLELVPNPLPSPAAYRELLERPEEVLPRIGEHDYYYRRASGRSRLEALPSMRLRWILARRWLDEPTLAGGVYNPESEAFAVSLALLETFYREVLEAGALPVVVLFPARADLLARAEGRPPLYAPLRAALEERGLRTLDLADGFARLDPEGRMLRRKFVHYPPEGNRMVAFALRDWLAAEGLDSPGAAAAAAAAERSRPGR